MVEAAWGSTECSRCSFLTCYLWRIRQQFRPSVLDFVGNTSPFVSPDNGVTLLVMVCPVQILMRSSFQLVGCLLDEKSLYCG